MPSDSSVAEQLPLRYRETLDVVDRLMENGARLDALRLRAQAIDIYSSAWDAAALRRMEDILSRAIACREHGGGRRLRSVA